MAKATKKAASEAARLMGARGASKGGLARAAALTPERRREIARNAVMKRHHGTAATPEVPQTLLLPLARCPDCGSIPARIEVQFVAEGPPLAEYGCPSGHAWKLEVDPA